MSKPYFDRTVKAAKDLTVNMTCNVASHFLLRETDVYWLKNGFEKLKFKTTGNQEGLLQSTTIELAATSNDSYIYQGYFQCVAFAPRFMKEEARSSKLQVQFEVKFSMYGNLISEGNCRT